MLISGRPGGRRPANGIYGPNAYHHDVLASAPLAGYRVVVIRAMGLNPSDAQLANLDRARRGGTQIITFLSSDDLCQKQKTERAATDDGDRYHAYGGVEISSAFCTTLPMSSWTKASRCRPSWNGRFRVVLPEDGV